MSSGWGAPRDGEQQSPVEMRFIDMFMTALGSLVFIALALVILLPKAAEVVISGTVVEKGERTITIDTPTGKKVVTVDGTTIFRKHLPSLENARVGQAVDVAGRNNLRGTFLATRINFPLEASPEDLRTVFGQGHIVSLGDGRMVVQTTERALTLVLKEDTQYVRALTATLGRFAPGHKVHFAGRLNDDQSVSLALLQSNPEPDRIAELEGTIAALQAANTQLINENAGLRGKLRDLERERDGLKQELQNARTEDGNILKRWLSVQLVVRNCPASDVFFYVRYEGNLIAVEDGRALPPAAQFEATRAVVQTFSQDQTVLFGNSYAMLGSNAAGHDQHVFHAVTRGKSSYSVYAALRNAQTGPARTCAIQPIFTTWKHGVVVGDPITLNRQQPFAWLRQFEFEIDGSNDLMQNPSSNPEFRKKLEEFSLAQSQALCASTRYCGTMDAHWAALRRTAPSELNRTFTHLDSVDLIGGDLGPGIETTTVEECRWLCDVSAQCNAYTFNKWKNVCFLKSAPPEMRPDPRATSGWTANLAPRSIPANAELRRFIGKAFPTTSKEIILPTPPVRALEACLSQCENNPLCLAVNYYFNPARCQLLSATTGDARPDPGAFSAAKLPRTSN